LPVPSTTIRNRKYIVELMGDDDTDTLLFEPIYQLQYLALLGNSQSGCRFIHNQDPGIPVDRPGYGYSLSLTSGKYSNVVAKGGDFACGRGQIEETLRSVEHPGNVPLRIKDAFPDLLDDLKPVS